MTSTKNTVLLDVQGLEDTRGVALQQAGIKNVKMPLQILQKNGQRQHVQASATMSVGLTATEKGTHMSRFVIQLNQWGDGPVVSINLAEFLTEMKTRLNAETARTVFQFDYFIEREAPVSGLSAKMAYPCTLKGQIRQDNTCETILSLVVPCATLCPCSKAISDYGAHNQRAAIKADLVLDPSLNETHPVVWIEDVVHGLESQSSCPVYPLIKRVDEKFITEKAYETPKFVEDVARDAVLFLQQYPGVTGFHLEVEAFESIHAHNAWAMHRENFISSVV
ncbi:MAG: GTP cyclohydrolase FolE2 [Cyanobacteria bacterium P01_H01_bin.74]